MSRSLLISASLTFAAFGASAEVNVLNGSMYLKPKLPLSLVYDHQKKTAGLFGRGWCSELEHRLLIQGSQLTYVHCGSGMKLTFTKGLKPNLFTLKDRSGAQTYPSLSREKGSYQLRWSRLESLIFSDRGDLEAIHQNQRRLAIKRLPGRLLVEDDHGAKVYQLVIDSHAHATELTREVNQLLEVTRFSYDQDELKTMSGPKTDVSSFEYDRAGRISSVKSSSMETAQYEYNDGTNTVSKLKISDCTSDFAYRVFGTTKFTLNVAKKCGSQTSREAYAFSVENGEIIQERRDENGRPLEWQVENARTGQLVTTESANGYKRDFNADGVLIADARPESLKFYQVDSRGLLQSIKRYDRMGQSVISAKYDDRDRLREIDLSDKRVALTPSADQHQSGPSFTSGRVSAGGTLGTWQFYLNKKPFVPGQTQLSFADYRDLHAIQEAVGYFDDHETIHRY